MAQYNHRLRGSRNSMSLSKLKSQWEEGQPLPKLSIKKSCSKLLKRTLNYPSVNLSSIYSDNIIVHQPCKQVSTQFHNVKIKNLLRNKERQKSDVLISEINEVLDDSELTSINIPNYENSRYYKFYNSCEAIENVQKKIYNKSFYAIKPIYKTPVKKCREYAIKTILKDINPQRRFVTYLKKIRKSLGS